MVIMIMHFIHVSPHLFFFFFFLLELVICCNLLCNHAFKVVSLHWLETKLDLHTQALVSLGVGGLWLSCA